VDFLPNVPLILCLRNPGMRDRHWTSISDELGFKLDPVGPPALTLIDILNLKLTDHIEMITKVCECAAKEYQIE
jgi:dynein heavy chain